MYVWTRRWLQGLFFLAGRIGFDPARVRGGIVLCLHDVTDGPAPTKARPFSISSSVLDDLVGWLRGFAAIVHLTEVLERPSAGGLRCALVFDDAGRSLLDHAMPVLAAHGVPWAIAVPTSRIGRGYVDPILRVAHALAVTRVSSVAIRRPGDASAEEVTLTDARSHDVLIDRTRSALFSGRYEEAIALADAVVGSLSEGDPGRNLPEDLRVLKEEELALLTGAPVTFISHGHRHLPLPAMSPDDAVADWTRSVEWLRDRHAAHTAQDVHVLPYGRFAEPHADALRAAGCRFLLTGAPGLHVSCGAFNVVPRVPAHAHRVSVVAARIAGAVHGASR